MMPSASRVSWDSVAGQEARVLSVAGGPAVEPSLDLR